MQQLSGLDAAFLYMETPNAPMHVSSLAIYDPATAPGGSLRFKQIIKAYREREHLARCFCQRIVEVPLGLDHPYWVNDAHYDPEFHIRHIALPKPGDWRQLCIQVARLHARPLDREHPLWEAYVIGGLDNVEGVPPGAFAIFSKIHHAAIDGMSGNEILSAMHDLSPVPETPADAPPWQADRNVTGLRLLGKAAATRLKQPFGLSALAARTMPSLASALWKVRRGELQRSSQAPHTRFSGIVSPHRSLNAATFKLDDFRAMSSQLSSTLGDKTTINDLALTVCGGALHHYLSAHDALPDTPLVAMVPLSVRHEHKSGEAGNQVSAMFVPLGTHLSDPFERLEAVRDGIASARMLTDAVGSRTLTEYTQFIPPVITAPAVRLSNRIGLADRLRPAFNCVVTNVPGPQVPLYLAGAKLVASYGFLPLGDNAGLGHVIGSYCGQLTVGVTACREMMPDPELYLQCLQTSFDELQLAVMPVRRQSATRRG